jgi:hypothetical protein
LTDARAVNNILAGTNIVRKEEAMKKAILFSLSLFLVVGPALGAHAQTGSEPPPDPGIQRQEPPSTGAILGDFIFVRPFGVIATALGLVGTVVTLPIAIPSGSTGTVAHKLVSEPFAFTFTRPLGTFSTEFSIWP